jgi:hypothetical protein
LKDEIIEKNINKKTCKSKKKKKATKIMRIKFERKTPEDEI